MQNSTMKYQSTPFNAKEFLCNHLMCEDTALAEIIIAQDYSPRYVIVPDDKPMEGIDLGACLEETLYRLLHVRESLLPQGFDHDELVYACLGATNDPVEEDDTIIDIDLGYHVNSILSVERAAFTARTFEKLMYERFKLIWMLDHGFSVEDAFSEWRDFLDPANGCDTSLDSEELFDEWEMDNGFSGELYPSFYGFLESEYRAGDDRLFENDHDKTLWKLDQPKD